MGLLLSRQNLISTLSSIGLLFDIIAELWIGTQNKLASLSLAGFPQPHHGDFPFTIFTDRILCPLSLFFWTWQSTTLVWTRVTKYLLMEKGVKEGCADVGVGDSMKTVSHPSTPSHLAGFINSKRVHKVLLTLALWRTWTDSLCSLEAAAVTKTDWTLEVWSASVSPEASGNKINTNCEKSSVRYNLLTLDNIWN